jgi:dipeptidyl aminopeptidase/acylaminoacyl peptidase
MNRNTALFTRLLPILSVLLATSVSAVERREEGALVIEGVPDIPDRIVERMRQYQNTRTAAFQDWDPARKGMLIATRFAETSQIHRVDFPLAARKQLTFFPEPVDEADFSPDPKVDGFLFSMDVGGGEAYQLHLFDRATGNTRLLTDGEARNGGAVWSNAGDRYAFYSTRRNGRDWDLYVAGLDSSSPERVLEEGGFWGVADWSPDDKKLLVSKYVSVNESYPYLLDVESEALEPILPSEEKIAYGAAQYAADGKGVYFTSDHDSEFKRLRYYDLASKSARVLSAEVPWDVESVDVSDRGDLVAFTVNEDGIGKLYLLETATEKYEAVPGIPTGQIYGVRFDREGGRLAMVLNTPQTPGDVFVLDTASRKLERWTESEVGGLDTSEFSTPELIRYETFDEVDGKPRTIPAFVYKPKDRPGPHPVLIRIHGGPESQYLPYFSSPVQYYVGEMGIAVVAPNVRGSEGYGKSYLKLDNGKLREDSVKDIGALLDWIGTQPDLDSSRVAVMGGSYGGYMVLASMVHYADRLTAGIDIVGISNFVTFLENTEDYRRDLRRVEYGDESDPEMRKFLESISPTNHAERIVDPLYIAQGANDPRVPASESDQMVEAIREKGNEVWYVLAKDEGHGFQKKTNGDFLGHSVVLFLEKYLLAE